MLTRRALRGLPPRVAAAPALRRRALRFAGWTTLSALVSLVVWRRSEFIFLAHYSSDAQIGLYSIAFAMVIALAALPERLSSVLVSAFATLQGASAGDRIRSGFSRSLRLLLIVSLPLTAGAAAVGPALLEVIYGAEYREAGTVLIILVVVIPFLAVSSVSSSLMSGLDDARTPLVAGMFAAAVNIALAFLLIPAFDASGAAAANAGAQVAATAALYAGARRFSGPVDWQAASLVRCALAAVGCAVASRAVVEMLGGVAGVSLAIVVGSATFAGSRWRCVSCRLTTRPGWTATSAITSAVERVRWSGAPRGGDRHDGPENGAFRPHTRMPASSVARNRRSAASSKRSGRTWTSRCWEHTATSSVRWPLAVRGPRTRSCRRSRTSSTCARCCTSPGFSPRRGPTCCRSTFRRRGVASTRRCSGR